MYSYNKTFLLVEKDFLFEHHLYNTFTQQPKAIVNVLEIRIHFHITALIFVLF